MRSQREFKDYSQETFPDYNEELHTHRWPSLDATEGVKYSYVDQMPPQYAAAALAKLRRWALGQYADEMSAERYWAEVVRTPLAKALAAKATSTMDLSEALEETRGLSVQGAIHLVARSMLEGAGDEEDPMDIAVKSTRAVTHLYGKGYVISRPA